MKLRGAIHALWQVPSLSHCPAGKYETNSHGLWIKLWMHCRRSARRLVMAPARHLQALQSSQVTLYLSISYVKIRGPARPRGAEFKMAPVECPDVHKRRPAKPRRRFRHPRHGSKYAQNPAAPGWRARETSASGGRRKMAAPGVVPTLHRSGCPIAAPC